jgi:hypothetical protein
MQETTLDIGLLHYHINKSIVSPRFPKVSDMRDIQKFVCVATRCSCLVFVLDEKMQAGQKLLVWWDA